MTPDGAGCLLYALAVAIPFGLAAAGLGWLLNLLVNVPGLVATFVFVGFVDGITVASLRYWRATPRARDFGPLAVFCMFTLLGTRLGRGTGLLGLMIFALGNGLFGYAVVRFVLRDISDDGSAK